MNNKRYFQSLLLGGVALSLSACAGFDVPTSAAVSLFAPPAHTTTVRHEVHKIESPRVIYRPRETKKVVYRTYKYKPAKVKYYTPKKRTKVIVRPGKIKNQRTV